ncbi:MAG: polynucleotide kinase-phosphatase [Oscillochloris sp.]|nr:polynucleotide kinase-phosphatase [Oscillochloris sp.]
MQITIPELALVVLIGPSGAGKSTFARDHFGPTEVLSSDFCRGLVADDQNDQSATGDAFDLLHYIARKRLAAGRLTVVDATNVQPESRRPLIALAREFHVLPVAIVFDLPERLYHERNASRPDRNFGPHVIRRHTQELRRSLRGLPREGFRYVYTLDSPEQVAAVQITRQPLWNNRKYEHGPFDIIGDIHGCYDELLALLAQLGYAPRAGDGVYAHSAGRKAIFLGDLVDRGPKTPAVLRLVMSMVAADTALCVPGNHDTKLLRKLRGRDVRIAYGLAETLEQLSHEPPEFHVQVAEFIDNLISHFVLDDGKLVVAHAGMKQELQGRGSGRVREFALYGETTGETDEFGLPVRYNWAADYRGAAMVVYGHTPIPEPEWLNRTINIDTGCVFGGRLTALRYPERELVTVPALQTYAEPSRPFLPAEGAAPALSAQQQHDDLLDIADVTGKRIITTGLLRQVTIREENAIAALEVMSRFAANPKWLIYLPPTMSPSETSRRPGLLEHPEEAFAYYRNSGVSTLVCEAKHMGSRAVVVLCRDEDVARRRFGVIGEGIGICYTRTGRRFFSDAALEQALLYRLNRAAEQAGLWAELNSDWMLLDCELLPWSAKAQELLTRQYAPVGAAATMATNAALETIDLAAANGLDVAHLREHYAARAAMVADYRAAYARYCWPVHSLADLRLAPFHLLATQSAVHADKDHHWHMAMLARLASADDQAAPLLLVTAFQTVDLHDPASVAAGVAWWEQLTAGGGEGMVVKPLDFVSSGDRGVIQPAIKCRGREYLRIIYGPEYTAPEHLERLRARGLGAKRSLALREFALGLEGLDRFVRGEPLRRVHECVFGVLALESEPVDPRL